MRDDDIMSDPHIIALARETLRHRTTTHSKAGLLEMIRHVVVALDDAEQDLKRIMVVSPQLNEALKEYKAAVAAAPFHGEAGWIDDFQRRKERVARAIDDLLRVAAVTS